MSSPYYFPAQNAIYAAQGRVRIFSFHCKRKDGISKADLELYKQRLAQARTDLEIARMAFIEARDQCGISF